jgi:hypothetical protein
LPLLRSQPWIATVAAAVLIVALAAGVWQRQRIGRWMTSLWTQAAPKQAGKHDGPTPRDDKGKRDAEQPEPEATPRHGGKAAGEPAAPPASSKAPAKGAGGSDAKGNSASASSPVQSDPPSGATGAQPAGSGRVAAPPSSSTAPTSSSAAPSAPAPPSGGSTTSTTTTAATKKYGTPEAVPAQTVYRPAKGLTYTSLQEAIQHAEPREQIWLGPGDFTEAIAPIKKALVLRGAGRDATRIDLSGHNGLVFSGASGGLEDLDLCCAAGDAVLTIDGAFRGTLTRLRVRIGDGWGIVINGTAAAEIVDVTFEGTGKGTVSVRPAAAARAGR